MTDSNATELLKKLLFDVQRLEYEADKPGSNMTLGEYEEKEAELISECAQAVAATLGSGTLTAEQVSGAVYAHSIHADCADADWQAIAEELNELGSGTCSDYSTVYGLFICSECGCSVDDDAVYDGGMNYCPGCGARVKGGVE